MGKRQGNIGKAKCTDSSAYSVSDSVVKSTCFVRSADDRSWFVQSLVYRRHCNWLIDTAAGYNILNIRVFKQLRYKPKLSFTTVTLVTAGGKKIHIFGETRITVVISGHRFSVPVIVADLGVLNGILGMQFLTEQKCSLDTFHGKLYTNNNHILLHRNEVQRHCSIRLKNTVVVRPYQDKIVIGFIEPKCPFTDGGVVEMPGKRAMAAVASPISTTE